MAFESSHPREGRLLASRFRVLAPLETAAHVHRGVEIANGREVVLKWLRVPVHAVESAQREALAWKRICHPNVVDTLEVLRDGDELVLVMEHLRGTTLASVLLRGEMPLDGFISVTMSAMYGVAEAHRCGILHRSVRPEHIMLLPSDDPARPHVKVLGFGLAATSARSRVPASPHAEQLAYASAEQLANPRAIDERSDVYSFSALLFRAISGRFPRSVASSGLPLSAFSAGLPSELERALGRALAQDRNERMASLPALITALKPFTFARGLCAPEAPVPRVRTAVLEPEREDDFISASPSLPPSYDRPARRRAPARGVSALVLVALAVAALLWSVQQQLESAAPPTAGEEQDAQPLQAPATDSPTAPRPRRLDF